VEKGECGVLRSGKTWLVDLVFPSGYLEVLNISFSISKEAYLALARMV